MISNKIHRLHIRPVSPKELYKILDECHIALASNAELSAKLFKAKRDLAQCILEEEEDDGKYLYDDDHTDDEDDY